MLKKLINQFLPQGQRATVNSFQWSENPGCFERHLQRRCGNPLFRKARRTIMQGDIFEARDKDQKEFNEFLQQVIQLNNLPKSSLAPKEAFKLVQEKISPLILKGLGMNRKAVDLVSGLVKAEEGIFEILDKETPVAKDLIERWKSLAVAERNSFILQAIRKDSPILPDEKVAALLCEDLETIKFAGWLSRTMPHWEFHEGDVMDCLKEAINDGFDTKKAELLINVFREWPATNLEADH